jgi:hypothetical protein
VLFSLRCFHLGKAFSNVDDKYSVVFNAGALALLDVLCIPVAAICCIGFWRLCSSEFTSNSGSVHSALLSAAGNAIVDLLLLPAVALHVVFPWRVFALFCSSAHTEDVRVAVLRSVGEGFLDIPFAFMALTCSVSGIQTLGMMGDVSTAITPSCSLFSLFFPFQLSCGAYCKLPTSAHCEIASQTDSWL